MTTIKELQEIVKANAIGLQELRASQKEMGQQMRASQEETSKQMQASQEETSQQIQELRTSQKEMGQQMRASQEETSKQMQASQEKTSKQMRASQEETSKQMQTSQEETNQQMQASQEETSQQIRGLRTSQEETDEQMQKHREIQKKIEQKDLEFKESVTITQEILQEVTRKLESVSKQLGSLGITQGDFAEEYFYRSLEKDRKLGDIQFDDIEQNVRTSPNSSEIDILLSNGNCAGIIEVKYKFYPEDIKTIISKKVNFLKKHYPKFRQIYFGVATMVTNPEMVSKAKEEGIFLLTQNGDHLEIVNDQVKTY